MSETIEQEPTNAIAVKAAPIAEWTPRFAVSVDDQLAMLRERDRFYAERLKADVHYGVIPGTSKPTLYKAGAETLLSSMALHARTGDEHPPIHDFTGDDHHGEPFIRYSRYCAIYRQTGPKVDDRIEVARLAGSCNAWEEKYRYRKGQRACPKCGVPAIIEGKKEYGGGWVCWKKKGGCDAKYRDNDTRITSQTEGQEKNPYLVALDNTILKIADKRALVASTLVATGCSDIFTQDVEDMGVDIDESVPQPAAEAQVKAQPSRVAPTRRRAERGASTATPPFEFTAQREAQRQPKTEDPVLRGQAIEMILDVARRYKAAGCFPPFPKFVASMFPKKTSPKTGRVSEGDLLLEEFDTIRIRAEEAIDALGPPEPPYAGELELETPL